MKSLFLKKQGASPKNKVLDFLITYSELDYSLKEMAKQSGAGYSTIKLLIKKLVQDKWILPTRKISKIKLYKLNINNPEVKKFIDFYWAVIENEIKGKENVTMPIGEYPKKIFAEAKSIKPKHKLNAKEMDNLVENEILG